MLWRRKKSLSDIDKVDLLAVHSVKRPRDNHNRAYKVCPVSVCPGGINVLPRQSIEAGNVPSYMTTISSTMEFTTLSTYIVDGE